MGTKYPLGASPKYPPRDWTCPDCHKYHSKPHYAHKGQIDYSKEPQQIGRVKFGREDSYGDCDSMKGDTPSVPHRILKKLAGKNTGDQFKKNGNQHPLFCPHCGWEDTIICIMKV